MSAPRTTPPSRGQVLVMADMLGLTGAAAPRLAKQYADLGGAAVAAVAEYAREVREGEFPGPEHSYDE